MPTATTTRKGIGGPSTPEGKMRVSLNALKHGLNAESPQAHEVIAEAVGTSFESVLDEMRDHYKPADPVEELLVRRVARCAWRLMITETMEDRIIQRRGILDTPGRSMERLILHERRIDIQLHRAIAALERLRLQKNAQNKLPNAPSALSDHERPQRQFVPPNPIRPQGARHLARKGEVREGGQPPGSAAQGHADTRGAAGRKRRVRAARALGLQPR